MPLVPLLFPDPLPPLTPEPGTPPSPETNAARPDGLPTFCEVRVDVPLARDDSPAAWERSWRRTLAKSRLTGLASGEASAVSARVRVCGVAGSSEAALERFLPTRLHALPGSPAVQMDAPACEGDWRGVRIWLSFPANVLPSLLRRAPKPFPLFTKGRRS